MTSEDRTALANLLKSRGNTLFSKKDFTSAIDFYTRAIAVTPVESAVFYSNRAACKSPSLLSLIDLEKEGREEELVLFRASSLSISFLLSLSLLLPTFLPSSELPRAQLFAC